jgi:thiamine-monophosphate kinase
MDVSDGLSLDLARLSRKSGTGARVSLPAIPVAEELHELAAVLPIDPLRLALAGGEDYELLAALPQDSVPEARRRISESFGVGLTDVGDVTEDALVTAVDAEGNEAPLEAEGWDHFAGP